MVDVTTVTEHAGPGKGYRETIYIFQESLFCPMHIKCSYISHMDHTVSNGVLFLHIFLFCVPFDPYFCFEFPCLCKKENTIALVGNFGL